MEWSFRAGVGTTPDWRAGSGACRASSSLFRIELEGLEVGGKLGLGQRVMGVAQVSYMEAVIEVGNSLGFSPNFLTFSLCDLEHITSVLNFQMILISQNWIK